MGAVSKALIQEEGSGLAKDIETMSNIKFGKIEMTDGHNLGCKHVFHCTCPSWNKGSFNCKTVNILILGYISFHLNSLIHHSNLMSNCLYA